MALWEDLCHPCTVGHVVHTTVVYGYLWMDLHDGPVVVEARLGRRPLRPEPPTDGHNWIQTLPGKSWFGMIRLYGPLEPWFDKTWRLPDIEPLTWRGPSDTC